MKEHEEQSLDPQDSMENSLDNEKIDIVVLVADFIRYALRYWYLFVLCTALAGALLYFKAVRSYTPTYECRASFTVASNNGTNSGSYQYSYYYDSSMASQLADTFPYILESDILTDKVKQDLGVDYINGTVSAEAVEDSNLFVLTVSSSKAQDALDILNSVIDNYDSVAHYVIGDTELNMIEEPLLPEKPINANNSKKSAAKGAFAGFMLAGIIIFLISRLRDTVRKEEEVKERLNVNCLGVIPAVEFKKRRHKVDKTLSIHNHAVGEGFIECNRSIALRLEKSMKENHQKVVLVTGTTDGEGVSLVAHNLVYSLADTGRNVMLIEFGRHTESHFKNSNIDEPAHGLEEVLASKCVLDDAIMPGEVSNISYLRNLDHKAQVQTDPITIRDIMHTLRKRYDYVVIDAPSYARMSDVAVVAELSDNVVYVVEQDKSRVYRILEGIEESCSYGAYFSGVVLNKAETGIGGYGYGKYGKYGHYYGRYGRYGYGRYGYGSRYGGRYGSRYGSRYGNHYGGGYGNRYGSRYGDRYGARYGENIDEEMYRKEEEIFLKGKKDENLIEEPVSAPKEEANVVAESPDVSTAKTVETSEKSIAEPVDVSEKDIAELVDVSEKDIAEPVDVSEKDVDEPAELLEKGVPAISEDNVKVTLVEAAEEKTDASKAAPSDQEHKNNSGSKKKKRNYKGSRSSRQKNKNNNSNSNDSATSGQNNGSKSDSVTSGKNNGSRSDSATSGQNNGSRSDSATSGQNNRPRD